MTDFPCDVVELAVLRRTSFTGVIHSLIATFLPLFTAAFLYLDRFEIFHRTGFNPFHWRWPFMILAGAAFLNAVRHALRHDAALRREEKQLLGHAEALELKDPQPLLELQLKQEARRSHHRRCLVLLAFACPLLLFVIILGTEKFLQDEAADLVAMAVLPSILLLFLWTLLHGILSILRPF